MYPRRIVLIVVLLLISAFSTVSFAESDTLVIGASMEAIGLDPRLENDVPSFERINVIMEPLVEFNVNMEFAPRLAREWEVSEDTMTLRFKLQENVFWHDGVPFTADDVKYTYEWVLNPGNAAPNRGLYEIIEEIDVISDTELVFRLSEPNPFLLNNIVRLPIVPRHDGERSDFRQNPVGTGPYKFVSWTRDDRMILVENENYWGARPIIPNIVFRTIPETSSRLLAFEAGEIDITLGVVPLEIGRLEADPNYIVQRTAGTGYDYIGFNTQVEALSDVRVRQALCYLIDREGIVTRVLNGIGIPGVSPLVKTLPWFNPNVERYEYNPQRAKELLEEGGYQPGEIQLRLFVQEHPERMRIAEIMQFEAKQVGIEIQVTVEEFGAHLARLQETDDFDLFIQGWVGQLDPDRAMIRQFHTDGAHNWGKYSNKRVDYLLEAGRHVPPESQESLDIYGEAQEIIVREAPYGFVNYHEVVAIQHRWIENWEVHTYSASSWQNVHLVTKNK